MRFSTLISCLKSAFPERITHGTDSAISVMVTPGAPFASHLRSKGNGRLRVCFKSDAPRCQSVSGFDDDESLLFANVDAAEAPLLLKTLVGVVDFELRLHRMVQGLYEGSGDPKWTAVLLPKAALKIENAHGSIDLTHADDCVHIFAQPLEGVYNNFMSWDGYGDGLRTGALMLGDAVFVGAQEEEDSTLSFAFRFPEDEAEIRALMAALLWIFRAYLERF